MWSSAVRDDGSAGRQVAQKLDPFVSRTSDGAWPLGLAPTGACPSACSRPSCHLGPRRDVRYCTSTMAGLALRTVTCTVGGCTRSALRERHRRTPPSCERRGALLRVDRRRDALAGVGHTLAVAHRASFSRVSSVRRWSPAVSLSCADSVDAQAPDEPTANDARRIACRRDIANIARCAPIASTLTALTVRPAPSGPRTHRAR